MVKAVSQMELLMGFFDHNRKKNFNETNFAKKTGTNFFQKSKKKFNIFDSPVF